VARSDLPDDVYQRLLAFRTELRRFLRWSEARAREQGLSPAQHQLLLAIRGHQDPAGPTVGDLAEALLLRHHSAVGLVDRAEAAGLVQRIRDAQDHRVVRLRLTPKGAARLAGLSALHLEELRRLADRMPKLAEGLTGSNDPDPLPDGDA
jgi:DNA-binding MarR family transcriptional regulator